MNRNFPAFFAALLTLVLFLASVGGFAIKDSQPVYAAEKVIYMTFDDGPSDRVTPKVLDILKKEKVPATFFIIGQQALSRKQIVKRAADEGHTIGIHSYTHNYKQIYSSPESLLADIEKCNGVIKMITGRESTLYRFPGGSFNLSEKLTEVVSESGFTIVDWNCSLCDAEIYNPTPYQLYMSAINSAENKSKLVLLAHDSTTKLSTVDALSDIIHYFREKGYTFKAL
jgi:peptidoglycan/xylan/chitin deacetylase (PgdA/CDA1 family)